MSDLSQNCLMIDDDPDDHEIFELCLREVAPGIGFRALSSGPEAIGLLTSESACLPGWIFLDMNMPRMNGLACLKELRSIERLQNTQIYMFSTTKQHDAEMQAASLGAAGFIVKPERPSELRQLLSSLFSGTGKFFS